MSEKTEQKQIWRFWAVAIAVFILLILLLRPMLLPFAAAFVLSYFLHPLVDKLQKKRMPRGVASLSVLLAFIFVLGTVLTLLLPLIEAQAGLIIENVPKAYDGLRDQWLPQIETYTARLSPDTASQIKDSLAGWVGNLFGIIGQTASGILSRSLALFDIATLAIVTPIVTFYLLRDWLSVIEKIDGLLPRAWAPTIRAEARKIDRTLAGYVRGQALVSTCLGIYYASLLSLSGLQFGLTVGLVTGVLSFIPFVGTTTGLVTSIILALGAPIDASRHLLYVLLIFLVGQLIEGNYLTPRLVGERTGLHPVWVIFALMAGGSIFGFLGVLIALPMAATVGVLVRFAIRQYKDSYYYDKAT